MRTRWLWVRNNWKRLPHPIRWVIVATVGSTLVGLGLLGLVLPVIPGIPLLIAGFALLATEFAWAEVLLNRTKHHVNNAVKKVRKQKQSSRFINVQNWQSIIVFAIALIITFAIWQKREGSLEMKSINTRKREGFYWLAILFTFALGTAGGDIFLDDFGVALKYSLIGFAIALTLVWLLWKGKRINPIAAFWIAYVLTRPLGAATGDFLSLPKSETGLGLGATTTSIIFLALIATLVTYLTVSKKDRLS